MRLGALDRLRLRLAAWYVGTYAVILLVLGGGLFLVVARQIRVELDRTLAAAADALAQAATEEPEAATRLRIPGTSLYLIDSLGHSLLADTSTSTTLVRSTAAAALTSGIAIRQLPSGAERVARAYARTFRGRDGQVRVAVAAANLEDLEDRYSLLITQFAISAGLALALVALGGVFVARKSAAPVEAVVEQMRRFLADAGHELRTPVTILRTEAEVALGRGPASPDDVRAFRIIAGEAERMGGVVDDLFTLARAEAAELPVERMPLYLDDVVSDAVAAAGNGAARRGVTLEIGDYQEAPVLGSAALLHRLVRLLLDNAIKYTRPGGRVDVSVVAQGDRVVVRVADSGIGIAPDALPRVFDRFFRADDARAEGTGAGLGLAIGRWIAEAHQGTLTLQSAAGLGTTACLDLPRHTPPTRSPHA